MTLRKVIPSIEENKLFSVILETIRYFNLKDTVVRVSGGWVRDKLLGLDSDDIDIALNNQTGKDFANYVNSYMKDNGLETHRIGVIVANPEQSKHLETAKVKIMNHVVDFVNLRSETYSSDANHRIPERITFGSPAEDAERRDFTVNALFYNIGNGQVEDFTGKGISDLVEGVIRTPLPPLSTFLDDPLRILRAIRFATRLNFTIVDEIFTAARDNSAREALKNKVSRERIAVEVDKILSSSALEGLKFLQNFRILHIVFQVPRDTVVDELLSTPEKVQWKYDGFRKDTSWIQKSFVLADRIHGLLDKVTIREILNLSQDLVFYSIVLYPLFGQEIRNIRGKMESAIIVVARDSLKQKNSATQQVYTICKTCSDLRNIMENKDFISIEEKKSKFGGLIREAKELWFFALLLHKTDSFLSESDERVLSEFSKMLKLVESYGLEHFFLQEPLLNGREIMQIAGITKGGPVLGKLLKEMWQWQAIHPTGSKEDVAEFIRELSSTFE